MSVRKKKKTVFLPSFHPANPTHLGVGKMAEEEVAQYGRVSPEAYIARVREGVARRKILSPCCPRKCLGRVNAELLDATMVDVENHWP
jgi:hypothetical protein